LKRGENGADMTVKIKFFAANTPAEGEVQQYRVKFVKKRGSLMDWYEDQDSMRVYLAGVEEDARE